MSKAICNICAIDGPNYPILTAESLWEQESFAYIINALIKCNICSIVMCYSCIQHINEKYPGSQCFQRCGSDVDPFSIYNKIKYSNFKIEAQSDNDCIRQSLYQQHNKQEIYNIQQSLYYQQNSHLQPVIRSQAAFREQVNINQRSLTIQEQEQENSQTRQINNINIQQNYADQIPNDLVPINQIPNDLVSINQIVNDQPALTLNNASPRLLQSNQYIQDIVNNDKYEINNDQIENGLQYQLNEEKDQFARQLQDNSIQVTNIDNNIKQIDNQPNYLMFTRKFLNIYKKQINNIQINIQDNKAIVHIQLPELLQNGDISNQDYIITYQLQLSHNINKQEDPALTSFNLTQVPNYLQQEIKRQISQYIKINISKMFNKYMKKQIITLSGSQVYNLQKLCKYRQIQNNNGQSCLTLSSNLINEDASSFNVYLTGRCQYRLTQQIGTPPTDRCRSLDCQPLLYDINNNTIKQQMQNMGQTIETMSILQVQQDGSINQLYQMGRQEIDQLYQVKIPLLRLGLNRQFVDLLQYRLESADIISLIVESPQTNTIIDLPVQLPLQSNNKVINVEIAELQQSIDNNLLLQTDIIRNQYDDQIGNLLSAKLIESDVISNYNTINDTNRETDNQMINTVTKRQKIDNESEYIYSQIDNSQNTNFNEYSNTQLGFKRSNSQRDTDIRYQIKKGAIMPDIQIKLEIQKQINKSILEQYYEYIELEIQRNQYKIDTNSLQYIELQRHIKTLTPTISVILDYPILDQYSEQSLSD